MNQRELFLRHVAQTSDAPLMGVDMDIIEARGSLLTHSNGRKYIDLISGISVSNIGHCHPKVLEAINRQAGRYMHLMVYGEFNQRPQVDYARTLTALLPEKLKSVFFTTGGSEAVEGAMKLAKRYTRRTSIVSFKNAYHGSTQGSLSIMGSEEFKSAYRPLLPDTLQLEYNNIDELKKINTATAAVFVEPVQGEAGVVASTHEFLQALRDRCTEVGCLLVFDEIQTGFGRTGSLFAFERYKVTPDVLLVAKGMGGGLPIGAFISSGEIMACLSSSPPLGHLNTFGGNAVCVAAAQACLDVIITERLAERAKWLEKKIREGLQHPGIKSLRVIGALACVDFGDAEKNMKVIRACLESGIISDWFLFCNTGMRIAPPLNIPEDLLDQALKSILNVLEKFATGNSN